MEPKYTLTPEDIATGALFGFTPHTFLLGDCLISPSYSVRGSKDDRWIAQPASPRGVGYSNWSLKAVLRWCVEQEKGHESRG